MNSQQDGAADQTIAAVAATEAAKAAQSARARNTVARLAAGGFAIIGSIIFAVGVCAGIRSLSQSFGTGGVDGIVVALESQDDAFLTVVEYRVDGKLYRAKGAVAFDPPAHKIGQTVHVLYAERQPSKGYVDSFVDRWLFAGVFTVIGGPFALGGFCVLKLTKSEPG